MIDIEHLEALARECEKVSPSPWRLDAENLCVKAAHGMIPANFDDPPDGEYIAAMDPATTLALLKEIKQLRNAAKSRIKCPEGHTPKDSRGPCWFCDAEKNAVILGALRKGCDSILAEVLEGGIAAANMLRAEQALCRNMLALMDGKEVP